MYFNLQVTKISGFAPPPHPTPCLYTPQNVVKSAMLPPYDHHSYPQYPLAHLLILVQHHHLYHCSRVPGLLHGLYSELRQFYLISILVEELRRCCSTSSPVSTSSHTDRYPIVCTLSLNKFCCAHCRCRKRKPCESDHTFDSSLLRNHLLHLGYLS